MPEIARLRTIKRSLIELKQLDPATCITENYIRSAVKAGSIRSIRAGNRFLIDQADLENLIENMTKPEEATTKIRRINER